MSRPCRDPKWYSSMRWLVPIAAASSRRLISAIPPRMACSIAAASRRSEHDLEQYGNAFDFLQAAALGPRESRDMLIALAEEI